MTTPPSSEFSYDLYPGLDAELQAALDRNIATGNANQAEIATAGLASAVGNIIDRQKTASEWRSQEARLWVTQEIEMAALNWKEYPAISTSVPFVDIFNETHVEALNYLHEARQCLVKVGDQTPDSNINVGETMHLTLMPWQLILENLHQLPDWICSLNQSRVSSAKKSYIDVEIFSQLQNNETIYRNPKTRMRSPSLKSNTPDWLSTRNYLAERIADDGEWGVILTQTSSDAGMKRFINKSPDQLTESGKNRLAVQGYPVDSLGILEWLCMGLQHPTAQLSANDQSWLLANRLKYNGKTLVPYGVWGGGQPATYAYGSSNSGERMRTRMAIIG